MNPDLTTIAHWAEVVAYGVLGLVTLSVASRLAQARRRADMPKEIGSEDVWLRMSWMRVVSTAVISVKEVWAVAGAHVVLFAAKLLLAVQH